MTMWRMGELGSPVIGVLGSLLPGSRSLKPDGDAVVLRMTRLFVVPCGIPAFEVLYIDLLST